MSPSALVRYPTFDIQPITFAAANGWDPFAYLILEFVASGLVNKNVNEFLSVKKLIELRAPHARRRTATDGIRRKITMRKFTTRNQINGVGTVALLSLEDLVVGGRNDLVTERFLASIDKLTVSAVSR